MKNFTRSHLKDELYKANEGDKSQNLNKMIPPFCNLQTMQNGEALNDKQSVYAFYDLYFT